MQGDIVVLLGWLVNNRPSYKPLRDLVAPGAVGNIYCEMLAWFIFDNNGLWTSLPVKVQASDILIDLVWAGFVEYADGMYRVTPAIYDDVADLIAGDICFGP